MRLTHFVIFHIIACLGQVLLWWLNVSLLLLRLRARLRAHRPKLWQVPCRPAGVIGTTPTGRSHELVHLVKIAVVWTTMEATDAGGDQSGRRVLIRMAVLVAVDHATTSARSPHPGLPLHHLSRRRMSIARWPRAMSADRKWVEAMLATRTIAKIAKPIGHGYTIRGGWNGAKPMPEHRKNGSLILAEALKSMPVLVCACRRHAAEGQRQSCPRRQNRGLLQGRGRSLRTRPAATGRELRPRLLGQRQKSLRCPRLRSIEQNPARRRRSSRRMWRRNAPLPKKRAPRPLPPATRIRPRRRRRSKAASQKALLLPRSSRRRRHRTRKLPSRRLPAAHPARRHRSSQRAAAAKTKAKSRSWPGFSKPKRPCCAKWGEPGHASAQRIGKLTRHMRSRNPSWRDWPSALADQKKAWLVDGSVTCRNEASPTCYSHSYIP